MNKKFLCFLFFVLSLLFFTNNKVGAKEEINHVKAYNGDEVIGGIYLYDDYNVEFSFKYRLKDVRITICQDLNNCNDVAPKGQTYRNEAPYESMGVWSMSLVEYLPSGKENIDYTVTIAGNFRLSATAIVGSNVTLHESLTIVPQKKENSNDKSEEILTSFDKVVKVCNKWIIPGLYVVLAVWFVVKGVLLAIDLVKYADNHDYRREKLKAFTYLAIALLCVAAVNTGVGFLTGLFG